MRRRDFIKALGGAGALGLGLPSASLAAGGNYDASASAEAQELCTLLDLTQCIGCEACVQACKEVNAPKFPEPAKPFPEMLPTRVKAEDWSARREETDRLTPYSWLYIQRATVSYEGRSVELNIPRRCMHCRAAPCVNLCPWGAASRDAKGIVSIDSDICLGGAKCRQVCPWKIPQRQTGVGLYLKLLPRLAGNGVMYKCDRCHERVLSGGVPACIEVCPQNVQTIGPRDQIVAAAQELAKKSGGFLYGLTENGGTNTIYHSPVPFPLINKAIAKGPGQPHLTPVAKAMEREENMAMAVLAAPVAGIVGGLLRVGSHFAKDATRQGTDQDPTTGGTHG